jgi:hypothetical protein
MRNVVPRKRSPRVATLVGMTLLASLAGARARAADAGAVRAARPVSLAVAVPDLLLVQGRDVTMPLPGLHLGVNLSPHLAIEAAGGGLPLNNGGSHSMLQAALKWYFLNGAWSPTLGARVGAYLSRGGDGGDRRYSFVGGGPGLEYAGESGFLVSGDVSVLGVSYTDGGEHYPRLGMSVSFAIGYRFGGSR